MNYSSDSLSEVLIVGGGVIGLALARRLHQRGVKKITILERGSVGQEASYAAAGMLSPQAEIDEVNEFFYLCDESKKLYPRFTEELYVETGIDIELDQSGTPYLAFTSDDVKEIRHRFASQRKADLEVHHLSAEETRKLEPFVSPDVREALFFPETGRLKIENC
jgi:glycine oxidase